jgi:hypothetical protein
MENSSEISLPDKRQAGFTTRFFFVGRPTPQAFSAETEITAFDVTELLKSILAEVPVELSAAPPVTDHTYPVAPLTAEAVYNSVDVLHGFDCPLMIEGEGGLLVTA